MAAVQPASLLPLLVLLLCAGAQASRPLGQEPISFLINGEETSAGRYPYFVSLRDQNTSYSYYDYDYSPPPPFAGAPSVAPKLVHQCGGVLISDWLVLTAAHCAPQNSIAYSSDFKAAGLPFTSFPNTFSSDSYYDDNMTAFIGADRLDLGSKQGNPVQLWFVHPWYEENSLQYDIAVGLLTYPEKDTPKAKLIGGETDIYDTLSSDANLTSIGLGYVLSLSASTKLQSIISDFTDPNDDPNRKLGEVVMGSPYPRVPCGKELTNRSTELYSSSYSTGNVEYASSYSIATIVSEGQFCLKPKKAVGPAPKTQGVGFDTSFLGLYNDSCQGDSGGPIFKKGASASEDVMVGIISWGIGCGLSAPSVYTSLASFQNDTLFDDFLTEVMQKVPDTYTGNGEPYYTPDTPAATSNDLTDPPSSLPPSPKATRSPPPVLAPLGSP